MAVDDGKRRPDGVTDGLRQRRRCVAVALALALAVAAPAAQAWQSWRIEQIYSTADGTVQYVVLHETLAKIQQGFVTGRTLTSTHGAVTTTFTFPADLPNLQTANRRMLLATPAFAALNLVRPDYTLPSGFVATTGGTLAYAGVDSVSYPPLPADGTAVDRNGAVVPSVATSYADASAVIPALPVPLVEFYNVALDHYFISDLQPDIDALDTGHFPGWARTGQSFKVYAAAPGGGAAANPVCRFYIPPGKGNSHFFSASAAECAALDQKRQTDPEYAGYVYESPNAFYIALPDTTTGGCPGGTMPVFRLWNQRVDSNHRYTTDPGIKGTMLAKSYIAEGYGPNAVIMCAPTPGTATLQFLGIAGAPDGALVGDGLATATANYQGYGTTTDTVNAGPRSGSGEVIAFGNARAVSVQPVAWSTAGGNQTVPVPLAAQIEVPVTIWVVAGPFASTQQTALTLWQTVQTMYASERFGISLSMLEVVDATANPKAPTWSAFTCGTAAAPTANVAALQADIGARAGRINVYLVGLVDGSTSRGNACAIGGGFVAIAAGSGADLLAHELGHDFALEHIDDLTASFDETNVMHSLSSLRRYLTEGQTFRGHLRPASAVNAVYAARPGLPTRACDRDTMTLQCPAIAKRIWADGAYRAN